jgi:hypothetical protein
MLSYRIAGSGRAKSPTTPDFIFSFLAGDIP